MIFLLWRREAGLAVSVRQLGISPDYLTATWVDYDQAVWIRRGGERIGAYLLQIRRTDEGKAYVLYLRSRMQLTVFNVPMPVDLDLAVAMNDRFEMSTVQGVLSAAGEPITADAFVEGRQVFYRLKGPPALIAGGGAAARAPLKEPVILADAILPIITQTRKLKVGSKWSTVASDPINGRFSIHVTGEVTAFETIEVEGNSVDAYRVIERAEDTTTTSWYDAQGNLLKSDLGNGLEMIAADLKQAMETYPALRSQPKFPPLDRESIRAEAMQSPADSAPTLPWLPHL